MANRPPNARKGHSAPYARPGGAPQTSKWTHDLFGPKSNVYSPSLGQLQPDLSARQQQPLAPGKVPRALNGTSQAQPNARFGIKGGSNAAARAAADAAADRQRTQAEAQAAREQARQANLERQRQRQIEQDKKARALLEEQHAVQTAVAQAEQYGFVVQVSGLVYGTSAEDVKTAFGQYGATTFCFIVNEATAKEGDELVARLTFERHADAAEACAKLNGAVADGRPLVVQLADRTALPAALPPVLSISTNTTIRGSTPTGPKANRSAAPVPSKMYADEVAAADGSMDVDQPVPSARNTKPPTAPRAMLNTSQTGPAARGGRSGGRGGAVAGRPAPVKSLSARLGITTGPVRTQSQGHGVANGGQARGQVPTGPKGNNIFARVGAAPANGAGGGKGGKAGGSLLARLK